MKNSNAVPSLNRTSRYLIDGYRWQIQEEREDRYFLIDSDGTDTHREVLRSSIPALLAAATTVEERHAFNDDGTVKNKAGANSEAAGMTPEELFHCHLMMGYMILLAAAYAAGTVKLHKRSLEENFMGSGTDAKAHLYALIATGKVDPDTKLRKGTSLGEVMASPGASDLKRMFRAYREPGFVFTRFRKAYAGTGGKRLPDDKKLVAENLIVEMYASERRMKIEPLRKLIRAKLNEGRPEGEWTIQPPSYRAIKRLIAELQREKVIGARFGEKAMDDETGSWTEGPRYTRPGEMVLLDCYKTDLVVSLKRLGLWMRINPTLRRLLTKFKKRVWICVALDAATRVVLGFSFGLAESAELAVRTLRMAMTDKSHYAEAAGCNAEPPRPISISGIHTDSGSAFRSARFRTVAYNVTGNVQIGVVGIARHRGMIERLFRTIHDQLLAFFDGQTFSNVVERGDYDSVDRMTMFLADFGNAMFRWFCDCYHLQGHDGLEGQPPLNRFNKAIGDTGYAGPANEDRFRIWFGLDLYRKLTPLGIELFGVRYRSNVLAQRFKVSPQELMRIKVDPENLGRISVMIDNQWATLVGPAEMQGIPLSYWRMQCQSIAKKYGEQAQANFEIVGKALLSFANLSAEARIEANLEDRSYTSKSLDLAEKKIKLRFVYRPEPAAHGGPLSVTQSAANGYRTGLNLSLAAKTGALADTSDDQALAEEDLAKHEDENTLDDVMAADNDNIGEDELPMVDEDADDTDAAPVKPGKRAERPAAPKNSTPKAPTNTTPMPSVKLNKLNKLAGGQ